MQVRDLFLFAPSKSGFLENALFRQGTECSLLFQIITNLQRFSKLNLLEVKAAEVTSSNKLVEGRGRPNTALLPKLIMGLNKPLNDGSGFICRH
jgi:hypothetical protein